MLQYSKANTASLPFILDLLGTSEQALHVQRLEPKELLAIYNDYTSRQRELQDIAVFMANMLTKVEGVHSVKYRLKDPLHLLQKIIRKKKEYPERHFTSSSYLNLINDLIGLRVLHLYKESWVNTSRYIQQVWQLKRPPYAYIRGNEDNAHLQAFASHGCKIMSHPSGYKAVHFVIATQPCKQRYFAEVQLRTLFEDGWSEVDHNIRYPNHKTDELLHYLLQLLNKLTSHADELASLIRELALEIGKEPSFNSSSHFDERHRKLVWIQQSIAKLPIMEAEKQKLQEYIVKVLK
ncbi:RelA/SpoT domain-containing protein [Pontibacter korlensis]|uniref:RelA/SpoT domain-containing protein n=1 Tax=Pontibacter korlensis TaxID=400092 RepID=A0A0E3UWR0_9BACT|nr:RelA/SpoT domain-containing protein [Pontibacter korlensis]AKD02926.1 hypothetical protein PKOR_07045 [Pontibacter korlensis]